MQRRLSYDDRKTIENLYNSGAAIVVIASKCNISQAAIYRELHKGHTGAVNEWGRLEYDAELAQRVTIENLSRPRIRKRSKAV